MTKLEQRQTSEGVLKRRERDSELDLYVHQIKNELIFAATK